jgi:hypothetical protein
MGTKDRQLKVGQEGEGQIKDSMPRSQQATDICRTDKWTSNFISIYF